MKKKKTIGRYVRRTLLFALLGVIVICLAVFYLGKYKASKTDYDNKYSDEFWNQLPGFIHSQDIFEEFYELDCNSMLNHTMKVIYLVQAIAQMKKLKNSKLSLIPQDIPKN